MRKKKVIIKNSIPLEEEVGKERMEEIAEKEWKTHPPPKTLTIKSKKKYNPKSLANLVQYRKDRSKEGKLKSLSALRPMRRVEAKEAVDVEDNDKVSAIINMLPVDLIFDPAEKATFTEYVKVLLRDFNIDELSSGDIDDILSIAQMRVLELRLLKLCKDKPTNLLDATLSIEKLRKDMNKARESLGSRRKDRISVKDRSDITILDLARLFDVEKRNKLDMEERVLIEEENSLLKDISSRGYVGNSMDHDADYEDEEEDEEVEANSNDS